MMPRGHAKSWVRRLEACLDNQEWLIEQHSGQSLARITYPGGGYVVEFERGVTPAMRLLTLCFCLVADNRIIDHASGAGGVGGA